MLRETVELKMGEREFRASLEIKLKGHAGGHMGKGEFEALVGVLGKVVQVIEKEGEKRGGTGLGSVLAIGEIEGLGVESLWTFYEVVGGNIVRCT